MELISQEFIKPISPTPNHLIKSFEYSICDQFALSDHIPILLYYPALSDDNQQESKAINSSRLKRLKKSLSEILAHYYPLAGRLRSNNSTCVDCNDEGVPFLEAFLHNQLLEDILNNPHENYKTAKSFVPPASFESFSSSFLLLVQVTSFECGGTVVGVAPNHKILDMPSVITFLTDWATLARQDDDPNSNFMLPQLVPLAKFFPPRDNVPSVSIIAEASLTKEPCRINIYVFNPSSIANLKIKATSENITTPSRVDAVTSIVWKCLTAYSNRPSVLTYTVNLRKRVTPPMHAHHIGNFIGFAEASKQGSEKDMADMVVSLRKGLSELENKYVKRLNGNQDEAIESIQEMLRDLISLIAAGIKNDVDLYHFTSWCGFPFYDVDFGWGKPILFSSIPSKLKNVMTLIDTKDGGVKVYICLSEEDMKMLEKNTELLTYATLEASFPI
ncbi:hypothetical protein FXO38_31306 [Capsicum annuum]|uniref:stemmadenine O-acetyltransferase-like n=1 Tax=Capsicum annuum TaxID=4072 RepID=UPI0007BF9000|nr:stemmadenine O-acetyltransferase-like [Capsicum annuum]KAF3622411.1 hypothetical protein FXO38_31306 [Capsicum annuum]KAF3666533.1 hypothetical protein FXO37_10512 [Capsicum annuum]